MLRTIRRWFSTEETKQLSVDVDRLADRFQDLGHKLEGIQLRIDRHLNKLHMRDMRGSRSDNGELSPEERQIVDDLRRGNVEVTDIPGGDVFGNVR